MARQLPRPLGRRPHCSWRRTFNVAFLSSLICFAVAALPRCFGGRLRVGWLRFWGLRPPRNSASPLPLAPLDRRALLVQNAGLIKEIRRNTSTTLGDHDLLAHVRAARLNGQSAAVRLSNTIAWRQQSEIEKKVSDLTWIRAERELRRTLKCDYTGSDVYGRPVLVMRVGAWDVSAVEATAVDTDTFVLLNAMVCEILLRLPRPSNATDPRGIVVIMDMAGMGLQHLSSSMLSPFFKVSGVVRVFYPDMLAHIFVANAPWVFTALQTAIRPIIDSDSLSVLHISASLPEEMKALGVQCLPTELGGELDVFPYDETREPYDFSK